MILLIELIPSDQQYSIDQRFLRYTVRECDRIPTVLGQVKYSGKSDAEIARFKLSENEFVQIDGNTGWLTMLKAPDAERSTSLTLPVELQIQKSGNQKTTLTEEIHVRIIDCNDNAPVIKTESFSIIVGYQTPAVILIGSILTSDLDSTTGQGYQGTRIFWLRINLTLSESLTVLLCVCLL